MLLSQDVRRIKRNNMDQCTYTEYNLSTEGYYFKYRNDNNSSSIMRATLYNSSGVRVDDVRVSAGYGMPDKSHGDVINYFEARITLK